MSGKGSNRRREDTAKVEANWPTNWNVREREACPSEVQRRFDALRDAQPDALTLMKQAQVDG